MSKAAVVGLGTMGPGIAATLSRAGMSVTTFDVSPDQRAKAPQMIELARKNAKEGGIANVEFHQALIDRLPLPDASVDCVISNFFLLVAISIP